MRIEKLMTDQVILKELGQRLTRRRLDLELSQAELAKEAGVGKRTVERIEAGESAQVISFIRILRVLDLLDAIDALIPESEVRPMDLVKLKKRRQRVSKRRKINKPWTWGSK